ncbi:MAG: tetratricopeptide repeat protein [Alphaproteobacteria bacterium]|nr:tetratricopeptide repeat protein [Alphaproteobacteria bacterium]
MKKLLFNVVSIFSLVGLLGCASGPSTDDHGYSSPAMVRVAQKARKTGNLDAAINFYNRAISIEADNAEAYLGLAEVYIDKNLLDGASEYIKKAESLNCSLSRSSYLKAKISLLSGDVKKAEELFLKSGSVDAKNALGAIYDEKEEHKKAQEMYKQVISIDPNYIDAYNNMGLSLLLCERYKEAIFYLENACSLPEANVTYRSNLALAYGLSGNVSKARAVYAEDFEGDELEEKVAYIQDLLASKRRNVFK